MRDAVRAVGYDDPAAPFSADGVQVVQHITGQSWEIGRGVDPGTNRVGEQGAGDQGIVFGYATDETAGATAAAAPAGAPPGPRPGRGPRARAPFPWLRPDGKTQVSVVYEDGVPVRVVRRARLHAARAGRGAARSCGTTWRSALAPRVLGRWLDRSDVASP